jgi:serine/threonine protein kinase
MAEARRIGNYELVQKLGQGGMGTVFKARQVSMDRVVALKILPPSFARRKEFIERFMREARASAKLNHPNIVNGIDVGQDNGLYYFAMEFIDGASVSTLLKHGSMKEFRCLEIGLDMARALVHAHHHGILHRDIKPDNILIDTNGAAKLCDLGLARDNESEEEKSLTQQGQAVGTPHYISPEQAKGQRDLDVRTDLYSLGATLYHMATGRTMFDGPTSVVVMTRHLTDKAPNPAAINPGLSKGFVQILARLLVKDRTERYERAEDLVEDLQRFIDGKNPQHAEQPVKKWPFDGGEVTAPHTPVRRLPAMPGMGSSGADRSRISRSLRATGRHSGVSSMAAPVAIAAMAALGIALFLLSGRQSPVAESPDAPRKSDDAAPKKASRTGSPSAQAPASTPAIPAIGAVEHKSRISAGRDVDIVGVAKPASATDGSENAAESSAKPSTESTKPDEATATAAANAGNAAESGETEKLRRKRRRPQLDVQTQVSKPDGEAPDVAAALDPKAKAPESTPGEAIKLPPPEPEKVVAGPALAAAIEKAVQLAAESRFDEAAELFKPFASASGKADAFDRSLAQLQLKGLNGLHGLKQRVIESISASPGKFEAQGLFRKNLTGKLMQADNRAIHVADPKVKAEFPLTWKSINVDELLKLGQALLVNVPPDATLGAGVLAYSQNQDALARQTLKGDALPEAAALLALVDARDVELKARKRAERNAAAQAMHTQAESLLTALKFDDAAKLGERLTAEFRDSDYLQEHAQDVLALIQTAQLAVQQGAVLEAGNVALASNGADVDRRRYRELIDGVTTGYTGSTGFAMINWPDHLDVTLPKLYILREIRLLLWDGEDRFYRYNVEVSADGQNYVQVGGDHSQGEWRSWQTLTFAPHLVRHIRLHGLHNSANGGFHCVELEAYCFPPETFAKPKYPSAPADAKAPGGVKAPAEKKPAN